MEKFGCPGKYIRMAHQFHIGMLARLLDNGDSFDTFPVTKGVSQGYVLALMLFTILFSVMLSDAFCDDKETSIKSDIGHMAGFLPAEATGKDQG
ncbi:hypothetical protein NDU88_005948 [Pleurodeles waltl]|uniref:Uncharacterized protein n=1 Tax=Pleurodeles waltl TaxID=8319 RepID=A0AAV7MIF2_PLEWA|nr:hypothetical protein NDU88_005948 [Pleurodeles waltl]